MVLPLNPNIMFINSKVHQLLSQRRNAAKTKKSKKSNTPTVEDIDHEIIKEVFGGNEITSEDYEAFNLLSELVSSHTTVQTYSAMSDDDDGGVSPKRKIPKSV